MFFRLKTVNGKEIKLTEDHYLYRAQCNATGDQSVSSFYIFETQYFHDPFQREMVRAADVHVGDCLLEAMLQTNTFLPTKVAEITTTVEKGIYAPLTDGGKASFPPKYLP